MGDSPWQKKSATVRRVQPTIKGCTFLVMGPICSLNVQSLERIVSTANWQIPKRCAIVSRTQKTRSATPPVKAVHTNNTPKSTRSKVFPTIQLNLWLRQGLIQRRHLNLSLNCFVSQLLSYIVVVSFWYLIKPRILVRRAIVKRGEEIIMNYFCKEINLKN